MSTNSETDSDKTLKLAIFCYKGIVIRIKAHGSRTVLSSAGKRENARAYPQIGDVH